MKGHLIHLFEYGGWAQGLVIEALRAPGAEDGRCVQLLAHIVAAEEIWLGRLTGAGSGRVVWPERSLAECARTAAASHAAWMTYLREAGEEDLKVSRAYTTTDGTPLENSVKEIVTHVVNHGTHHRAQIVSRLRELGETPPATDYIFYVRAHPKGRGDMDVVAS